MIIIVTLLIIATAFLIIGQVKKADIILSPIFGFIIGALYNKDRYEDSTEITLQCCIGIISITVIWTKKQDG